VYKFTNPKGGEHDTDEEIYEAFYRDDVTHQQNLYSKK
jgi:hypothetical protein